MLNTITIHGRLVKDPELRRTNSQVSVCNLSVAVNRNYAKDGEERISDFFSVVCWRGLAELVAKYFSKGQEIIVSGEMQSRKWQDNDGSNRVSWEILASSVDFCGSKAQNQNAQQDIPAATPIQAEMDEVDEDLPF